MVSFFCNIGVEQADILIYPVKGHAFQLWDHIKQEVELRRGVEFDIRILALVLLAQHNEADSFAYVAISARLTGRESLAHGVTPSNMKFHEGRQVCDPHNSRTSLTLLQHRGLSRPC